MIWNEMGFAELMRAIKNGALKHSVPYSELGEEEFKDALNDAGGRVIEMKYEGNLGILTPEGLFSSSGKLKRDNVRSPAGVIFVGEYLFGTQWANRRPDRGTMKAYWSNAGRKPIAPNPFIEWMEQYDPKIVKDNFYETLGEYEGFVLKDPITQSFYKFKRTWTVDYVIMGFNGSESLTYKESGVASIQCGLYVGGKLAHVGNAGGLTDEERFAFHEGDAFFIGKVIEVSGKQIFDSGAVRHPNFVRMRPDKLPRECTLESVLNMRVGRT